MASRIVYQQSRMPKGNFREKLANELLENVQWYKDARREREYIVKQCDEAYLCHRYIPDTGAIQLIEDGEFGETDLFDNTNVLSIRLALATMPRNEPWLTVSSREGEADSLIQSLQDHQVFLHKKARTRRNMQRVWKQAIVRGRTGIHWEWQEEIVWRRLDDVANSKEVKKFLKKQGMSEKQSHMFTRGRYPHVVNSGPVLQPVDWWDLWTHPSSDLVNQRRPGKIIRRFFTLDRLMNEVDEITDKPIYDMPDKFEATDLEDLFARNDRAGSRAATERMTGTRSNTSQRLVPVYIIYMPKLNFLYEGKKYNFYDTYFYLALDANEKPYIVRMEENASDLGHSQILVDDWIDWFTPNGAGGISGIEKLLSKYNQKNLLQLLTITAAVHSIFPAQLVRTGAFREDSEVSFLPGALLEVDGSVGSLAEVMRPVPTPERGVVLGEQTLRFYADDMRASSGVEGLVTDSASRTLSKPKTATEVNRDVTSGSFFLDNQSENASDMLTDLCQAIFETSQQRLKPAEGAIEYERYLGDRVQQGSIGVDDFRVRRSIQVLGLTGQLNREQDLQNLLKAFEVTGQMPNDPHITPARLQIAIKLMRKLGVQVPEEMEMSAAELIATRPDVQLAAIEQAMQNPEIMQMLGQGEPINANVA